MSKPHHEDRSPDIAAGEERPVFEESTTEELLEQAQANAQAAIIATVIYLEEHGYALDEWTASLGKTFSRGWDTPERWMAAEFLDAMLTNLRSLGATVIETRFGSDLAEATITGFPDPTLCELFGADPAAVARFNDAADVLAANLGLRWEWHLAGEQTHLTVRRTERDPD